MSAKAIHEYDGKLLLSHWLPRLAGTGQANGAHAPAYLPDARLAQLQFEALDAAAFPAHVAEVLAQAERENAWLQTARLVAKPDQLIKRRGKAGLLGINLDWEGAKKWIAERAGKDFTVGGRTAAWPVRAPHALGPVEQHTPGPASQKAC